MHLKRLGKESILYGLSGVITRMITIFLVPLYTKVFMPFDYGILSLINTTFVLLGFVSVCALDNAAARWYYEETETEDRKKTFASWFWFGLALSGALCLISLASLPLAAKYMLGIPLKEARLIWMLPSINLVLNLLPLMIWNWYRFMQQPVRTTVFTLFQSLLTIGLTFLFVLVLKWGITGVFLALTISALVFSAIALIPLRAWILPKYFSRKRIKEMLRFAVPLLPATLAYWLLNSTDAYFIKHYRGNDEVGLFSIGASLASGLALFTGAFQQAWGPFAFSIMHKEEAPRTYADVFLAFGALMSLLVLLVFLFAPEALHILTNEAYYSASWVASILGVNIVLVAFTYIASIGTSIKKNNSYYAIAVVAAAVVTIVLDIVLIPPFGKEGSAVATVIAQVIVPLYLFYKAQQLYPIPYKFAPVIMMMLLAIGVGTSTRLVLGEDVTAVYLAIKVFVFLSVAGSYAWLLKEPMRAAVAGFRRRT